MILQKQLMDGSKETILGSLFGLGFAAMIDATGYVETMLMNMTRLSLSTFLLTCLSTVLFGALGAAGGWLFKYLLIEIKTFINSKKNNHGRN